MKFLRPVLWAVFFLCLAHIKTAGAEPFAITLSANGQSRSFSFDNVEDAIDTFSGTSLQQLLPGYTDTSLATAQINLRGLPATLSYPTSGTTLVLDVPSIGLTRSFTGASRNASQDALEDFFKGQDGQNALKQILQQLASSTPIDPVAGNPNSLLSRMGDYDYARGTDYREGFTIAAYQDRRNDFGLSADTGRFGTNVSDQTVTTADFSYSRHFENANASLLFDMPLMYTESEGAEAYAASLGMGLRAPVTEKWALTPAVRVGGIGSEDLGAAAIIYSGSVTSDYRIPVTQQDEFQLGNLVGYYKTDGVTIGDYNIDYDLSNIRLKNGIALNHKFTPDATSSVGRVYITDSRFFGDELYNEYYEEVGVSLLKPFTATTSAQIGASYLFADGYDGVKLNVDVHF